MNPIFKKLNFKNQKRILVLNAPKAFESAMAEMMDFTQIDTEILADKYDFILVFAEMKSDLNKAIDAIEKVLSEGDTVIWFAYPKKSSKLYQSDFNRDEGWENIGKLNVEPIRAVAIDADWSVLMFRKFEFIQSFKRKFKAYSEDGKEQLKKNKI